MILSRKILLWSLLSLPLLALGFHGTPSSATHIEADSLIVLEQEPSASIIELGPHYQTTRRFVSEIYEADQAFELLGLNWEQALPEGTDASIEIHFLGTDGAWTDWQAMEQDNDHPDSDSGLWTYVITEKSTAFQYRVFLSTTDTGVTPKLSNVSFDAVSGGSDSPLAALSKMVFKNKNKIQSRSDWGADNSMLLTKYYDPTLTATAGDKTDTYTETDPNLVIVKSITSDVDGNPYLWPQEYPKTVEKIIVHHTATSGDLDDPEAAIRAIYYYHAVTRGWGDIGYNYIVAPDGQVFQGRAGDEGVVAGHASGYNTGTIGIALLGNYEEDQLPGEMMQSLTALIYEKAEEHDIDIDGKTKYRGESLPNLMGHRDVSSTTCPGGYTYAYLDTIRELVAAAQDEKNSSGKYSYEESGDHELELVSPGGKEKITLKIKNTGTSSWNSSTYLAVKSNADAEAIITLPSESKGIAKMEESSVAPGETATFNMTVKASKTGGLAHFQVYPVFNGTEKNSHIMELGFYVEVKAKSSYSSSHSSSNSSTSSSSSSSDTSVITAASSDTTFEPGQKKILWVTVKNNSSSTWSSTGSKAFSLKYSSSDDLKAETTKVKFTSLTSGSSNKVFFQVTAPDEAGSYTLFIRPRLGSSNLTTNAYELPITVSGTDFDEESYDDPIRIKLTPVNEVGEPILTSSTDFGVYEGDELLKVFSANSRVRVAASGSTYTISSGSNKWTSNEEVRFVAAQGGTMQVLTMQQPNWNNTVNYNIYRGTIEYRTVDDEAVLINELSLEDYVKGMGEETNSTPTEKLKAMAILARTYAYYYMTQAEKFPGKPYDGEDDPATFQKYLGYNYEKDNPNIVAAAEATTGQIVTYKNKVVKTPYFSQSDGTNTKSAKEVWGWTDTPWLVSVPDSYCKATSFAGHGVGLSGCGAKAMAEKGYTFEEIIKYYYTGVELSSL